MASLSKQSGRTLLLSHEGADDDSTALEKTVTIQHGGTYFIQVIGKPEDTTIGWTYENEGPPQMIEDSDLEDFNELKAGCVYAALPKGRWWITTSKMKASLKIYGSFVSD